MWFLLIIVYFWVRKYLCFITFGFLLRKINGTLKVVIIRCAFLQNYQNWWDMTWAAIVAPCEEWTGATKFRARCGGAQMFDSRDSLKTRLFTARSRRLDTVLVRLVKPAHQGDAVKTVEVRPRLDRVSACVLTFEFAWFPATQQTTSSAHNVLLLTQRTSC